MEFLRLGSSIPGSYWGCCAVDVIQNFKEDPDTKASIQIVNGDEGVPIMHKEGGDAFAGMTYHEIFKSRLRFGTFSSRDMPNHTFLAVMTESQVRTTRGKKWLKILKEEGFEFIRTIDNSVYTGTTLAEIGEGSYSHPNYLFGLFRNIGNGRIVDPFKAPKEWTTLEDPYSGDMSPENMQKVQTEQWEALGEAKLYTRDQLVAAGVPITLAGVRNRFPQESEEARQERIKRLNEGSLSETAISSPWGVTEEEEEYYEEEEEGEA